MNSDEFRRLVVQEPGAGGTTDQRVGSQYQTVNRRALEKRTQAVMIVGVILAFVDPPGPFSMPELDVGSQHDLRMQIETLAEAHGIVGEGCGAGGFHRPVGTAADVGTDVIGVTVGPAVSEVEVCVANDNVAHQRNGDCKARHAAFFGVQHSARSVFFLVIDIGRNGLYGDLVVDVTDERIGCVRGHRASRNRGEQYCIANFHRIP